MYIRTLKPLKTKKEERKLEFKCPGSTNCQHTSDVIVSDVIVSDVIVAELNCDVIIRDDEVNKPVARKHYAQKHSLMSKKGFLKCSLSVCSQTFTKVALMLAIVINILGGMFNVRLPERISAIGTSSSFPYSKPRANLRCHGYPVLSEPTFARNVLAGKRLDTYISPSADFWASRIYYLDTYTVNLESDNNFTVFYDLVYLYMYTCYRSWSSCNWTTYPRAIIYTLVYFSLNSIVSVIKIHDKYQSLILIGLALTEKASSGIQSILFHFRLYWRGWRPLVTPWAGCIKEGIEPRISQKWFFPSHAQVRFLLFSLLLLLFCFCFRCSYCYYYYYCDAPKASEDFPAPMASPLRPLTPPAVQVRQYSWHHYAKKKGDLCDIRREFVGANRQTNCITPSLSQQKPLVARSHLMAVVRRVERGERLKGKLQKETMF